MRQCRAAPGCPFNGTPATSRIDTRSRGNAPQSELEPHDEPEPQLEPHEDAELQLEPHDDAELQDDDDVEPQLDALAHDDALADPDVAMLSQDERRSSSGASTASLTLRPPPTSKLIASFPTQESAACADAWLPVNSCVPAGSTTWTCGECHAAWCSIESTST